MIVKLGNQILCRRLYLTGDALKDIEQKVKNIHKKKIKN